MNCKKTATDRIGAIRETLRTALQGEEGGDMRLPIADLRQVLAFIDEHVAPEANTTDGLVEAVKAHALANYTTGWDVVVEAWTNGEIAEQIAGARTAAEAIAKFEPLVSVWADREAAAGW